MPNLILVPFRAEHALIFQYRDDDAIESIASALEKEKLGPGFTALLDGRPIGAAGISLMWKGVALAWTMLSEELMTHHAIWATRNIRRCLRDWIIGFNLHRVEAVVLADNVKNQRWIEMLGFSREGGVAKSYTHDKRDVFRYEFIRPLVDIHIRRLMQSDEQTFRDLLAVCDSRWIVEPFDWFLNTCQTLVAYEGDRLVGYTVYEYQYETTLGQTICIGRNIGVHPDYRKFGIASRLHVARIEDIKKKGNIEYLILGSHGDNALVEKLFTKFGAVKTLSVKGDHIFVQKVS